MTAPILELPFVAARLHLLDIRQGGPGEVKRSKDRTTSLVRRWRDATVELRDARRMTLDACEARPGKGGSVSLAVVDQTLFDQCQEIIKSLAGEVDTLENVIRQLNDLGGEFFDNIEAACQVHGPVEEKERRKLSAMTAEYIRRNPNLTPEEVLQLPDVLSWKAQMEATTRASKAALETLRPRMHQMDRLLSSVGC